LLGTLDFVQFASKLLHEGLVQLVLVELRPLIGEVLVLIGQLAVAPRGQLAQRVRDSLALSFEEFPCSFLIHLLLPGLYGNHVRAQIKEKREVAKGTLLVIFDLLGREVDFTPGQYFWVTLLDPPYDDEKGPRRHISVVTSPNERGVLGLCTRLRESAFKRSLAELPIGAPVDVEEPKGNFRLPEDTDQRYVFVAGGIGITVFRCMLRYIAEEQLPHRVTLVYSNRDRESAAFLDELFELEQDNPNLELVLTMTDDPAWDGESRRIGPELLRDRLGDDWLARTYLIAGPPRMVDGVVETLQTAGIAEDHLQPARFSGY
jgi:ferredoxin-NADP reductase